MHLPFLVLPGSSVASRKTSSELLSLWSLSRCSSLSTLWITHSKLLSTFSQIFSCTNKHQWNRTYILAYKKIINQKWQMDSSLTHSSSCKSACMEARLFLVPSLPSRGAVWREGEAVAREGEVGWREGERDGEREEGEREEEDGDGVLCWENSGRAAARATMAADSSLESHTVTSWRVYRSRRNGDG